MLQIGLYNSVVNTSIFVHRIIGLILEPDIKALPASLGEPRERLALYVIHECLPLVPEHVETRELNHPARPGLSQGKLLLWIDLFSSNVSIPPPIDITPRKPHK